MSESPEGRRPIPARHLTLTRRIAAWMADVGFTPDAVSLIGLAAGVGSGLLLGLTSSLPGAAPALWVASALLVLVRGLSNMFDGMLAVEHGMKKPTGPLFNEVPDRISDAALMIGAGYSLGGAPVAGWLCACLAIFVAYVRVMATLAGTPPDYRGPFAKQERMFSVALLSCILAVAPESWRGFFGPDDVLGVMAIWLWVVCLGCVVTAVRRIRRAAEILTRSTHSE